MLLAALVALLLAAEIVRIAAFRSLVAADPARAAHIWPGQPEADLGAAMTAIGAAARERRAVSDATLSQVMRASRMAPLEPAPFLVRGVRAQLAGDEGLATRAFVAARWRDGRSLPARYFLADQYLRSGEARHGLGEVAALARLSPGGVASLGPYIAAYSRDRSNWPQVRALLRSEPLLEDSALTAMAADPAKAETVLALANPARTGPKSPWLQPLLASLAGARQYAKARTIWSQVSGVPAGAGGLLFDARFTNSRAPPPFNWALASSTVGLAERQPGKGLHAIFYGQEDGTLASQLLVLPPGRYRLVTNAAGLPDHAALLRWTATCAGSNSAIGSAPLDIAAKRPWQFDVPARCDAQRLELSGTAGDVPQQVEVTIRSVALAREPSNG